MELDYVYRSRASEMAPAVDVVWLSDSVMAVAFQTGLIELINVEDRSLVSSYNVAGTIMGLCTISANEVLVQTKSGSLYFFNVSGWKCMWSISTKTAISFARPVVTERRACFVLKSQSVVGLVNIDTGNLDHEIELPKGSGQVVSIAVREPGLFLVLTESGSVFSITTEGKLELFLSVRFPDSSVPPTAMCVLPSGELLVGFSNGSVGLEKSVDGNHKWISINGSSNSGVGSIVSFNNGKAIVVGYWNGRIAVHPEDGWDKDQPHMGSIRSIASNSHRVAIASTDGRVSVWSITR